MKFTSTVYGAASGSIGGITYSRNRGGQYTRIRSIPSNPATERQGLARENLATAVAYWTNEIDATQRTAWASYAQATPVVDSLGQQVILSGQQMFIRSATSRLMTGYPIIGTAPTVSGLGNTPQWAADPVVDVSTGLITGTLEVDGGLIDDKLAIYMSRPVPQSRTPAHEPRRFASSTPYNVGDHIFEVEMPTPFMVTAGQLVRVVAIIIYGDQRISAEAFRDVIVVA